MLYIISEEMAPAFLHRSLSSICYSYRFRGALILYWFWIASDMANIRVGSCPVHERWFIVPWIEASSFAAMPLHGCLTVLDFSPRSSTPIYPSFFSASGPQKRNVHSIRPLICQFFVCPDRRFHFFKLFSSYQPPVLLPVLSYVRTSIELSSQLSLSYACS